MNVLDITNLSWVHK